MTQLLGFKDVFPKLLAPFSYPAGGTVPSVLTTGTVIQPHEDHLLLTVYLDGVVKATFKSQFPTLAEVTSGFSVGDFAGKLDSYKTIFASACATFGAMTHEVGEYGDHFQTSPSTKIISCGVANGYFDLVVTSSKGTTTSASGISAVNYSAKSSAEWQHSGDTSCHGNLVHSAKSKFKADDALPRGLMGYCTIVGYQSKPLHSWYGKSTGLFVIDEASNTTRFVPLDLSETTVRKNTVIVPLMYSVGTNEATGSPVFDWWIPTTMKTGMGDTNDVHKKPIMTELHRTFEVPAAAAASSGQLGSTPAVTAGGTARHFDPATPSPSSATSTSNVSGVFGAAASPVQLVCDASHLSSVPPCKMNALFWGRGLSIEDKNGAQVNAADRCVLPMVLPGEQVQCKAALLYTGGTTMLTPDQTLATIANRRLVVHIDGAQNVDSSFLGARKALEGGSSTITRLNSVFIVHIKDKTIVNTANLSLVSMYAGPQATVVFQTMDDKKYFSYWGTPSSVIPCPMSSEVNPEWSEFEELLENYLICATGEAEHDHQLVSVPTDDFGTFAVPLGPMVGGGANTVTFAGLADLLEKHRDGDYETKYSIVCHLFALEFILSKEQVEQVKKLVRSIFKSALSSKEKIAFFENIKTLTKEDRERIKNSAKLIDRLANRLCCRKYVAVNEFLAQFQEKLAGHGQKGAQKMELGLQCAKFVESGDPADLFETERDFMLVAIDTDLITKAVIAAANASTEQTLLHLTATGGDELVRLATLDPRTPELDGCTVDSLLALGMPHKLEAKGAMQFAVPIQDEDTYFSGGSGDFSSTKSLVFLPIFDQKVPDLNEFDVTVWAYVLVEGVKNSCLVPRDMKTKPRQIEYAVLKLLASFMKTLCDQRTTPVDPKSADVNDSLVKKIRSVYWLMRCVMFKNVGIMTPEPIMTLFSDGKANHVTEIEIALQLLPLVNKTGLPAEFLESLVPRVTEVFCRALYTPLETIFKKLLAGFKALQADESKAVTDFLRGAIVADSAQVKTRIRSRKCTKCSELKPAHFYPRARQLIVDPTDPQGYRYLVSKDLKVCFKCTNPGVGRAAYIEEEMRLVCPCSKCKKTKSGNLFDFSHNNNFATHHDCQIVPTGLIRRVPPKYCTQVGLPDPAICSGSATSAGGGAEEAKIKIPCGGPLTIVQTGVPYYSPATLQSLAISTSESMTFAQFVVLASKLGLLSPTTYSRTVQDASANNRTAGSSAGPRVVPTKEDLLQLQHEIGGILALMLNNFKAVPAWKEIVPLVVAGEHKKAGGVKLLSVLEVVKED